MDGDPELISVTMTREAAKRLISAMIRAAGWAEDKGKGEDADWLMWGVGRTTQAIPSEPEGIRS